MDKLLSDVIKKIESLNLSYLDYDKTLKITTIAFNSVTSYINLNFSPFFNFNSILPIIIDITIGEYLSILLNSNLYHDLQLDESIKSISQGDISLTYFKKLSQKDRVDFLAKYFLDKKNLIQGFKTISW